MSDITIPPEAIEAAAASICRDNGWPPSRVGACIEVARDACLAMLRAWPGMDQVSAHFCGDHIWHNSAIILPLTENSDG